MPRFNGKRRKAAAVGGGGGGTTPNLGINVMNNDMYTKSGLELDLVHGELITDNHTGSFVSVPLADRNSAGWPTVTGRTNNVPCQPAAVSESHILQWDQTGVTVTILSHDPAGGSPVLDSANKRYTLLPYAINGAAITSFRYSFTGTPPTFTFRPASDPGGNFRTSSLSKLSAVKGNGPIRNVKWTRVEFNNGVVDFDGGGTVGYGIRFPVDSDGQLLEPILTSTNRNPSGAADYSIYDGVSIERFLSLCTAVSSDAWLTLPWNADATYYTAIATLCAAFSVATGKNVYLEMSNEVWNGGYTVKYQAVNEAKFRGRTAAPSPAPTGTGASSVCTVKTNCRLLAAANISLSGLAAIDGVTPVAGDRILVIAQTTASQNGVWVAASGAWTRATDADAVGEIAKKDVWFVTAGGNANTSWVCRTSGTITPGTTSISITAFDRIDRLVEKSVAAWNYFDTAFASSGVTSKLKHALCWQAADQGASMPYFAAAIDTMGATCHSFGVAPYWGDNPDTGYAVGDTPTASAWHTAAAPTITAVVAWVKSWQTALTPYSIPVSCYEGGPTPNFTTLATKQAIHRASQMYDNQLAFYQQLNTQCGNIVNCHFGFTWPLDISNFGWGDFEDITQASTLAASPKAKAGIDFIAAGV